MMTTPLKLLPLIFLFAAFLYPSQAQAKRNWCDNKALYKACKQDSDCTIARWTRCGCERARAISMNYRGCLPTGDKRWKNCKKKCATTPIQMVKVHCRKKPGARHGVCQGLCRFAYDEGATPKPCK